MAEPLKNLLHPALVDGMADHIARNDGSFDRCRFVALASDNMDRLELMQRSQQIRSALEATLPRAFAAAAATLGASLPQDGKPGLTGWMLLPVSQYIAARGLADFDLSLDLLQRLTPHFTAEFGIRPFIDLDQDRALATILPWTRHPDQHVRRLASEGTRPRLPWAMRLPKLVRDPAPILPILTALIDDDADYVRRSVANSLNDIAKDHPDLVAQFVATHVAGASVERQRLLRHASRTLLKQGHAAALANFGFAAASDITCGLAVLNDTVTFGDTLGFEILVGNAGDAPISLMIDYAIHHRKADGLLSPKVFKWKTVTLAPGDSATLRKLHAIRPITTRRYYPGGHEVAVLINGEEAARAAFQLHMP